MAVAKKATTMESFLNSLEKKYGNQVVRREEVTKYQTISTGSLSLDLALRTGGWVEGRMHEIVGPEGVGKTTLVISSMIQAQKKYPDHAIAYIDMEQTFDYDWAEALGLDTSRHRFTHLYPDDSEDVSDFLKKTTETGLYPMTVVDSIGSMESNKAFEKDAGESAMGKNPQIITRMVKQNAVLCRKYRSTSLLVNQLRANIGSMSTQDQSAGPKALRYSTTTKTRLSKTSDEPIKYILPGDIDPVVIGRKIRARVERSKVSVEGKVAEFYLFNADTPEYGPVGIDQADEGVTIGLYTDFIEQRGAWYYFGDPHGVEVKMNGRGALLTHLRSCPDDLEWVRTQSVARLSHEVTPETEVSISIQKEGAEA